MDQEVARKLFEQGAMIILLDIPSGSEFGINMQTWFTGERFMGVKMIPLGVHMFHLSAASSLPSSSTQRSLRFSYMHQFTKAGETLIWRWDKKNEILVAIDSESEIDRILSNRKQLDRFLGVFPFDTWKRWISLTSCIDDQTIKRIQGCKRIISSATATTFYSNSAVSATVPPSENSGESGAELLHFTRLSSAASVEDSVSSRTKHSLDSTRSLHRLLRALNNCHNGLLAELQLSFVLFLVAHVYDAFEHWKRLVHLMCTCDDALYSSVADSTRLSTSGLFHKFIGCFYYQLGEIPDTFFLDLISKDNFLVQALYVFFSNVLHENLACDEKNGRHIDLRLRKRAQKFKTNLEKKYGFDFSAEPSDCAPVIVDDSGDLC